MAFSPAAKKRKGDNAASVVGSPGAASAQSGAQALSQRAAVGMSPKAPAKKPNSAPIEVFVWLYTKCGSDVFPGFPRTDLFGLRLRHEAFPAVDSDILASFKMFLGEKNAENDDYPADLKELKDYERIIVSLTQTPKDVEGRRVQTNMPLKEWSVMFWTDEPFHCMRLIADFSWWRAQHRRPADKSPWPDLSTLKMVVNPFVNVSMDGFNTDNITMPMTVNEPSTTLQCSIFESSPPGSSKMVEVRVQVIDQKTVFFAWEGRTFPYRERFDLKRIGREDNVRILPQARTDVSIADNAAFIRDVFKQGVLRDLLVHLVLEESSVPADGPVKVYLYDHNEAVKARTDNPYHSGINADIVEHLQRMLDRVNPYVHQFRHMRDIVRNHNPTNVQLCISQTEGQDMRRYNKPQTYEPAVVFRSSDGVLHGTRAAAVAAGSETTLTAWFRLNAEPPDGFTPPARSLHYAEVPQFFSWSRSSFSDLATVVHSDGNRQTFYQRRWNDDTSTWENSDVPDYRRACEEQGFANSSDECARCMEEAARLRSAPALRRLFAMLLLHCELASPVTLWQRFANDLCEDFQRHLSETDSENAALLHVQEALSQAGKTLTDFGLPTPTDHDVAGLQPRDVRRETAYDAEEEWTSARSHRSMMNDAQAIVFDQVADAVIGARPLAVFIDGPGGTGKTFVYKVLPVIPRVAREDLVQHSLLNHPLWRAGVVEVHALTENMRARGDADWQRFLLDIGDGRAPTFPDIHPEAVRLPDNIVAPSHWGPEDLARAIYADIAASAARCVGGDVAAEDLQYFCDRAILTPKNATADSVNVAILREAFPDTTVTYYSVDDVDAASPAERDLWPTDFLNGLTPSGLPPHELALAPGALVMLLRNLDADAGLVNGVRAIVVRAQPRMPLAGAASSSDDAPAFLDEGSEAPPSPAARPRRFARDHGPDDVDEFGPASPDDASANVVLAPLRQRGAVVDAPAPPETLFQTCAATENDNPSADSADPMPSTQLRCEAASSSKQRDRFTGFFERQRGAHCGMHALNNALGFALLDEGTVEASAHAFIEHAALDGLPQRLRDHMSPSGDYSEAVLAFVLQRCGNSFSLNLNAPVLPQDAMNIFAPNVVGVVVNQNNAHWIAVKAVSGRIWKLDSAPGDGRSVAEPVLCELSDFQKLLRRHPTAYPLLDIRPRT
ncbi:unnamed protein product [Prorocentrum cordatum]|uniref:ubiquitinyl hydrolase 1 n=1 Tax=Prorocentrum cordatum TaxID=2364126 RepID=A0ABN9R2M5_9DINO|nr:unnamed protein product [Polarella glacialis]